MSTSTATSHVIAMILIAILAIAMLQKSVDGNLMMLCIVAIAGLGGYEIYKLEKQKTNGATAPS